MFEPSLRSIQIWSPLKKPIEMRAALTVLRASGQQFRQSFSVGRILSTVINKHNPISSYFNIMLAIYLTYFLPFFLLLRCPTCQSLWLSGSAPHSRPSPWRKQHQPPPSGKDERVAMSMVEGKKIQETSILHGKIYMVSVDFSQVNPLAMAVCKLVTGFWDQEPRTWSNQFIKFIGQT